MKFNSALVLLMTSAADVLSSAWAKNRDGDFMAAMREATNDANRKAQEVRLTRDLMAEARPLSRKLNGDDDAYQAEIDLTQYALKYLGCQNIHTFSDDLAADEDSESVLEMDRFVVLRLCPSNSCSSYNRYGCNSGFGDYLIPMETYLYYMSTYYVAEYQQYCEVCATCTLAEATNDDTNANTDDATDDAVDDAAGDDAYNRRRLADDDYNVDYYGDDEYANANANNAVDDDDAAADDDNGDCKYYEACKSYQSACKDYSSKALNFNDYFQCSQFNLGNTVGYVGPHCSSDGKTIGFGIYQDQYCGNYVDDLSNFASDYGLDYSGDYMKAYYTPSCMSCLASESYDLYTDDNAGNMATQLCGAMYEESAKCNKYMNGGDQDNYGSEQQEETETTVCNFITNVIKNTYDENGEIILESGWRSYVPSAREMPTSQKWWLAIAVQLVIGLTGYSVYLHRLLTKNRFQWSTRRGSGGGPNNELSRMQSGILMGRSRSEVNYELQGGLLT